MTFLWLIQAIWGFYFIKESFNFIISGYAALWYYGRLHGNFIFPYRIYITKHLGSVIACAFMNGFFRIGDIVFDIARVIHERKNLDDDSLVYGSFKKFFDLVRS